MKQILTFSRQSEREKAPFRLGSVVQEALKLLRASLPASLEIKSRLEANNDLIRGFRLKCIRS